MRIVGAGLLVLATTSPVWAEAPGELDPVEMPPSEAPIVRPPPPVLVTPALHDRRFSINLSIGTMDVAPPSGADSIEFGISQLSLRYRFTDHLEAEFELGGGRQSLPDGSMGTLAMGDGTLGLKYRINPRSPWNGWALAGLGRTIIAPADSSKQERHQAEVSHVQLGGGIERRFDHFAIQCEVRWTAIGDDHGDMTKAVPPTPAGPNGSTGTPTPPTTVTSPYATGKLEGAMFTLGASYYF